MSKGRKIICSLLALLLCVGCSPKQEEKKGNVYYEIFVASFNDSNGDGYGDLKGVEEKLDYLDDLGVSGIWFMPIMPSPSYHKYDVTDYMAIDPLYGTMEDFESLVNAANDKNIDIIIDLVLNHSSSEHPWFVEAKKNLRNGTCDKENSYCDYYVISEEKLPNYHRVLGTDLYYEGIFVDNMPDLNLDSENVRREIEEIVEFWMSKGIKGFRLDAILHMYGSNTSENVEFLTWLNDLVKSYREDAYIVGEAWTTSNVVAEYYKSGISCFDFSLAQAEGSIVKTIKNGKGNAFAQSMSSYIDTIRGYNEEAINSVFLSNHDQGRSAAYFFNSIEKTKFMANVYLLLPGTPFVYYGEEIGMLGSGRDENKRLGFVWDSKDTSKNCYSPSNADYTKKIENGLVQQSEDKESLYSHYKNVIALRNQHSSLANGNVSYVDSGNEAIYMVITENEEERIVTVHNFSENEVSVPVNEFSKVSGTITTGKVKLEKGILTIPAYSSAILG